MERNHRAHALRIAVAAGLGLCLSLPLAAQDTTQSSQTGNQANQTLTSGNAASRNDTASSRAADERFLGKATKANEKEVAAATVALQKASSQDVREYANHLLRDHQDMLVKLDETAVALGVSQTRRYTAMSGWGSSGSSGSNSGAMGRSDPATAAGGTRTGSTVTGQGTGTTSASGTSVSGSAGGSMSGSGTSGSGSMSGTGTGTGTGTSATTTASSAGSTGYESGSMASTDSNRASTGMTTQAVPAEASNDPAVRKLSGLSGANFDRAFAEQMVTDHKKTIAEFERASTDKSLSSETRTLASNALPKLRNHLAMAESLRGSLKSSAR